MRDFVSEAKAAAAGLAPPVSVMGAQAAGWGPSDWMYALTAVYVVLQALYLVWKWNRERKSGGRSAE